MTDHNSDICGRALIWHCFYRFVSILSGDSTSFIQSIVDFLFFLIFSFGLNVALCVSIYRQLYQLYSSQLKSIQNVCLCVYVHLSEIVLIHL